MEYTKHMRFSKPGYDDAADIEQISNNFEKIEEFAGVWNSFSNFGEALLTGEKNITITTKLPIYSSIFAITFKVPKTFEEGDTLTVNGAVYNLMEGSNPALNEAFVKDEVITVNFDDGRRFCWSAAGGGAPRELPSQISGMRGNVIDGSSPTIRFTWSNPNDNNFSGLILIIKEGSAPNSPTDGLEVFRGISESYTYTAPNWERTYYARGFAYNSQRRYQLDAQGAIASARPSKIPPVSLDLTATPDGDSCKLTWLNTASTYLEKAMLIQKIGSAPASPTDGTKLYEGKTEEFTATNLQSGVHYYWTVFALNSLGEYNAPSRSVEYTPQLTPTSYQFLTCLVTNTAWQPPADGAYRITCIGKCADGEDGVDAQYKTWYGRGGNGGGSGGIARSILVLKASNRYNCTVDSTISSFEAMLSATAAVGMEPGSGTGGTEFNVIGARGGAGGAGGTSKNWNDRGKVGESGGNNGASPGEAYRSSQRQGDWGGGGSGGGGANYVLPNEIRYDDILYTKTQRSLSAYKGGNGFGYEGENRELTSGSSSSGGIIEKPRTVTLPLDATNPTPYPGLLASDPVFYGGGCGGGGSSTGFPNSKGVYIPDGYGGTLIIKDKFPTFGSLGTPGVILIEKGVF